MRWCQDGYDSDGWAGLRICQLLVAVLKKVERTHSSTILPIQKNNASDAFSSGLAQEFFSEILFTFLPFNFQKRLIPGIFSKPGAYFYQSQTFFAGAKPPPQIISITNVGLANFFLSASFDVFPHKMTRSHADSYGQEEQVVTIECSMYILLLIRNIKALSIHQEEFEVQYLVQRQILLSNKMVSQHYLLNPKLEGWSSLCY